VPFTVLILGECRNPFQTRSTTSIRDHQPVRVDRDTASQSLPNQVNDFNQRPGGRFGPRIHCRNPFQTRSTTSIWRRRCLLQPNWQCRNPFQTRSTTSIRWRRRCLLQPNWQVAIPSKPGQRLQSQGSFGSREHRGLVAIPSKPGQRLQ